MLMQPGQQVEPGPVQNDAKEADQQTGWQFRKEDLSAKPTSVPPSSLRDVLSWTASEYAAHAKSSAWYVQLLLVTVIACALSYLLMHDWVVVATIIIAAVLFGIAAGKKPRVLNYGVTNAGVIIGQKQYPYGLFKSFSVIQEGPIRSIFLMPAKRFNPPMSMYYPPEEERSILETLGTHLPQEAREQDAIDRFMHKIRF